MIPDSPAAQWFHRFRFSKPADGLKTKGALSAGIHNHPPTFSHEREDSVAVRWRPCSSAKLAVVLGLLPKGGHRGSERDRRRQSRAEPNRSLPRRSNEYQTAAGRRRACPAQGRHRRGRRLHELGQ